jgi:quercetin dioxygenase-like cupin family protein
MSRFSVCAAIAASVALAVLAPVRAADLNPKAISIKLPKDMKWTTTASGALESVVYGDPSKPGLYVILVKWEPGKMSHPHYHPNDRLVTVLSGTWWVGTGSKFDPNSTVPLPAGSFAKHTGKEVHYDGAKNEEVVLEIVGQGPETSTAAETK